MHLSGRPGRAITSLSILLVCLCAPLARGGTAARLPSIAMTFAASDCPVFASCNAHGCTEASLPNTKTLVFQGLRIPEDGTNYPVVNAGLYFLKRYQSGAFLIEALSSLCRPQSAEPLSCTDSLADGQLPGATTDFDVYDVWAAVGYVPDSKSDSAAERQLEACREYLHINRNVTEALRPGVALQTNAYSEEGIRLRVGLMKLLSFRPIIDGRCQQELEARNVEANQCSTLAAYFDDLRFLHLLADKLASDGKTTKSWDLIRASDRSVFQLARLAVATPQAGNTGQAFALGLTRLLTDDWTALRAAIQKAL